MANGFVAEKNRLGLENAGRRFACCAVLLRVRRWVFANRNDVNDDGEFMDEDVQSRAMLDICSPQSCEPQGNSRQPYHNEEQLHPQSYVTERLQQLEMATERCGDSADNGQGYRQSYDNPVLHRIIPGIQDLSTKVILLLFAASSPDLTLDLRVDCIVSCWSNRCPLSAVRGYNHDMCMAVVLFPRGHLADDKCNISATRP
jgi:hypothetical protein